jgi:hypothetical protein
MAERPVPLVFLAPAEHAEVASGSYVAAAADGRRLLLAGLSQRLARAGAAVTSLPIPTEPFPEPFHWGRWFTAAARDALAEAPTIYAIGYAGPGALALLPDEGLDTLLSPHPGEAVANNRFSADAFVVAGDAAALRRALTVLEACDADNAAPRRLEQSGVTVRDLSAVPWSRFDVDTPLDLALLRLATRISGTRAPERELAAWLETARLPGDRPLLVPHLEAIGAVMRDRRAELVVAGRLPVATWHELETETACRVRAFVEERGMRSARDGRPRSILATFLAHTSPAELVAELARLGDAVVLDTRVLMAAIAGSPDAGRWPPAEERFASDFGDADPIATPWLRELTLAARDASVPFLLGSHTLISDGLRLILAAAWQGR